jgi:hypothetical protein
MFLTSTRMKPVPRTPDQLARALVAIFPSLPRDFGVSGESVFVSAGPTYDSILREFAYFFGKNTLVFTPRQLRRLGELVAQALAAGGDLAEAMETCFLQPTRQLPHRELFTPYLSPGPHAR